MKYTFTLIIVHFFLSNAFSQSSNKIWDKSFGGTGNETINKIIESQNGGFIGIGTSSSTSNGNKTSGNNGGTDIWLVKLDANGNKIWDKNYGGSLDDEGESVLELSDGSLMLFGSKTITVGNAANNYNLDKDYYVLKVSSTGSLVWQKTFGGTGWDYGRSITMDNSGNFYLFGVSDSPVSGSKTEDILNNGNFFNDFWVVKINSSGTKIWDKEFGSGDQNYSGSCLWTSDNNLLLFGSSDFYGYYSERNYLCIKINGNGQELWKKKYFAGINTPVYAGGIVEGLDGYYFNGNGSSDGHYPEQVRRFYADLYKIDYSGNELGVASRSGKGNDLFFDGQNIVCAVSSVQDEIPIPDSPFNVYKQIFDFSFYIYKQDNSSSNLFSTIGNTIFSTNADDSPSAICKISTGGFLLAGSTTNGQSKDKSQNNFGGSDWWILKVKNENCSSSATVKGLSITTGDNKSFDANWSNNLLGVSSYQWRYKTTSETNWSTTTSSPQFFGVQNISSGQSYHYQVKAVCSNGQQTPWSTSPSIYLRNEVPMIEYPSSVTTNELSSGGNIQVKGTKFTPNGNVTLEVRGISGFGQDYNFTANANGEFTQLVYVTTVMKSGKYTIKGLDYGVTSGARIAATTSTTGTPANKVLEFNVNLTSNLVSLTIPFAKFDESNLHVNFFWRDFLSVIPPYNTYLNAQGKRRVKYKIELGREVTPGNITWIQTQPLIDRYEKPSESKLFYEKIFPTTSLSAGKYVVRVTDELKTTNTLTSLPFDFIPVTPSISITKHWDYTYPDLRNSVINSVSADGVSRLYFKTLIGNTAVTKVKVELMDENNSTTPLPSLLGKLKVATNITSWSDEANDANQKTIFINSKIGDSFWCWYVAPDNFADGNLTTTSVYSFKSQRIVKVKITGYSSSNVEIVNKLEEIVIKRPPLYLVHGLGGDGGPNGTWDDFKYEDNLGNTKHFATNEGGHFPGVFAPQMQGDAAHDVNANILLAEQNSNEGHNRSFQWNIVEMRKSGSLVTSFDYVAHSMGGCMLRASIDDTAKVKRFYTNRNYGKGYVHKFITLTTPHNGSPLGDIVTDIAKDEYFNGDVVRSLINKLGPDLKTFFNINRNGENYNIKGPSNAVKDFAMANKTGGRKFGLVLKTPSHVIVSDYVDPNNRSESIKAISNLNSSIDERDYKATDTKNALNMLGGLVKGAALQKAVKENNIPVVNKIININSEVSSFSLALEQLNTSQETADFMNYYAGYLVPDMVNYQFESDLIVPLSSQLAGLPLNAYNVTQNKDSLLTNYLKFKANHNFLPDKICDNDVVGNRVFQLLNADVNSSLFGNLNASPYYGSGTTASISKVDETQKGNSINTLNEPLIDSRRIVSKVRIEAPMGQEVIPFGTEKNAKTFISDTTNLISAKIIIGNEILALPKTNANTLNYLFDNIGLGSQKIYLEAVYSYGLDSLITYWDSVSININNGQTPQALTLSQQDMYIFKGDTLSLNLGLKYPTYSGSINSSSSYVGLVSSNIAKVTIAPGSKNVIALDTGYVMLTYSYKSLTINQFVTVLSKQLLCKESPAQISHSNSVLAGEYDAHETIESIANVPNNTYYYAGKAIILKPGFSAGINETFLAEIRKCEGLETISTQGLVAYFPFNGNANDEAGTNNGSVNGATLTSDRFGNSNKAYSFDGNDFITSVSQTNITGNNPRTFSIWFNVTNAAIPMQTLIKAGTNGDGNDFTLLTEVNPSNQLRLYIRRYYHDVSSSYIFGSINSWYHAVVVYDGTSTHSMKFYINGQLISTSTAYSNLPFNTASTNFTIGNYIDQSSQNAFFNGKLDDIRIYNRALSEVEVTALYNSEKP